MRGVIQQSVVLPASPEDLFAMYLDPVPHAEITGAAAMIDPEPGSRFEAFGGSLVGTMLVAVAPRLIVQTWRSENFFDEDPDSTLFLSFSAHPEGGRIDLVHLDVPDQDFQGISEGWDSYYWQPWRDYLAGR